MMSDDTPRTLEDKIAEGAETPEALDLDRIDFLACLWEGLETTLYEGEVELVILPPIEPAQTIGLHRYLRSAAQVESVDVRLSEDRGMVVDLVLREPTRLLQILGSSPDIDKIGFLGKNTLSITLTAGDPQTDK